MDTNDMSKLKLSNGQQQCFYDIMQFFYNSESSGFVFSGVAGSGKTTIISEIINDLDMLGTEYVMVTPTAKAALVINRRVGKSIARTIHSLFYEPHV